jgi:ParB-like chromosome segregation protein Spo0J
MSANKWELRKVRLDELKVAENNPRTITNKHFQGLMNSIRRFGLVEPIVWNERTGRIIGGHQRYRALIEMGVTEAIIVSTDMSPEEEIAANLTLNNPAIEGEFDEPVGDLLKSLDANAHDLFKELNMDALEKELAKADAPPQRHIEPSDDDYKTTCPCCAHKWEVTVSDVKVFKGDE